MTRRLALPLAIVVTAAVALGMLAASGPTDDAPEPEIEWRIPQPCLDALDHAEQTFGAQGTTRTDRLIDFQAAAGRCRAWGLRR